MPMYGVDWTASDSDLTRQKRREMETMLHSIYGHEAQVETWVAEPFTYYRVITIISAPTLSAAIERMFSFSVQFRAAMELGDGTAAGLSVAIRDLSHPVESVLPPPGPRPPTRG